MSKWYRSREVHIIHAPELAPFAPVLSFASNATDRAKFTAEYSLSLELASLVRWWVGFSWLLGVFFFVPHFSSSQLVAHRFPISMEISAFESPDYQLSNAMVSISIEYEAQSL